MAQNHQYKDVPPPLKLLRPSQLDKRYSLLNKFMTDVVQNPIRARCCGFGEKDRRPIDPPPILELIAKDEQGQRVELRSEDSILFLAQCELFSQDKTENQTVVYTPWSNQHGIQKKKTAESANKPECVRNLIGSTVSNAYHLYNHENKPGIFFVFHDLSVRTEGVFTLKFIFVDLAAGEPLTMSTAVQVHTFSEPFSVYPAKKFPGLTESTPLSRCFSKQGIKIPIRNGEKAPPRPFPRLPISDFLSPES